MIQYSMDAGFSVNDQKWDVNHMQKANKINFKCTGEGSEQIPESVITKTGLTFPGVHTRMTEIASLSQALKEHKRDSICRLPFCVTVEAEAMGADINLGDEKNGPRVKGFQVDSLDDLMIVDIDLSGGRIRQVLNAVEHLNSHEEVVSLNVEGPFTIISSLIDPRIFYKGIRKERDRVDGCLKVIEDNIVKYAMEGVEKGAKILSYADPAGAMDIVGPKMYRELSGRLSWRILKRLQNHPGDFIVHLCGKTSTALEKTGFSTSESVPYDPALTYGEAIRGLFKKNGGIKIIGHSCIKRSPLKTRRSVLWQINLEPVPLES